MTRRDFLARTAATTAAAWIGPRIGAGDSGGPILAIDTHIHLYDPQRREGVPWPPKTDSVLYAPHLPADYSQLVRPFKVVGAVVVEASPWLEDNQWILDLVKDQPMVVGFVGNLKLATPEFAPNLKRFAANPLFRGLRIRADEVKGSSDTAIFADLQRISAAGLSIDVLGGAAIVAPTVDLAKRLPALRIVVDHLPFKDWDGRPSAMREALGALASQKNVYVKVSEVVRRLGGKVIDDPAYYRPGLDALYDLFGPDRLIYGSNWPVSNLVAPYGSVHRVVADYFAAKSQREAEKYFWRNSLVAYRWQPRGAAAALR